MDGLSNVNVESERTRSDEKVELETRVEELQKEMCVISPFLRLSPLLMA